MLELAKILTVALLALAPGCSLILGGGGGDNNGGDGDGGVLGGDDGGGGGIDANRGFAPSLPIGAPAGEVLSEFPDLVPGDEFTLDTTSGVLSDSDGTPIAMSLGELVRSSQRAAAEDLRVIRVDNSWEIPAEITLRVIGDYPLVIVATGDIFVRGTIDVSSGTEAGAGGEAGPGCSPTNSSDELAGGGGGGFGSGGGPGAGPDANSVTAGGAAIESIELLRGGCSGGNGGSSPNGGGAGGGALYLVSPAKLAILRGAVIHAGGAGGAGSPNGGGSGGGSGGMIALESPSIEVFGTLVANGGGGGAGGTDQASLVVFDGENAGLGPMIDMMNSGGAGAASTEGGSGGDGGSDVEAGGGAAGTTGSYVSCAAATAGGGGGGGGGTGLIVAYGALCQLEEAQTSPPIDNQCVGP